MRKASIDRPSSANHHAVLSLCCAVLLMLGTLSITAVQLSDSAGAVNVKAQREQLELEKLQLEASALRAQDLEAVRARADLERRKLESEIAALRVQQWLPWISGAIGLVGGFIATIGAVSVARRNRLGELDQAIHEQRLAMYPKLVQAAAPLAIYFPEDGSISPQRCAEIGRAMSKWYFTDGGLLLSPEARKAYFLVVRALTLASRVPPPLLAPTFPDDAGLISEEKLREYRETLKIAADCDGVEEWKFAAADPALKAPAQRFRDYVLLQCLSSALRTTLADDLNSRRRPSGKA